MENSAPKKTKILFVHHTTAVGGATNSMLFIIQALNRDEFDIEVLFLQEKGPASPLFERENIPIHYLKGITIYQHADNSYIKWISRKPWLPITRYFQINPSAKKLDVFFRDHQYDIVHVNTSLNLPVGIAAKRNGMKVVWHVREPLKKGWLGIRRALVRKAIIRNADKIIAISKFDASKLGENNKTEVIYNYVDFSRFDRNVDFSNLIAEIGFSLETRFITTLGGTLHSKGADVFIKSANIITHKYDDVVFLIAGYGIQSNISFINSITLQIKKLLGVDYDKGAACMALIKKFNLEGKVKFLGLRNDIPQILAASKMLIWPATISHFARPIIEAGAMAKPSIATDFPSSREVVQEGISGLFFPLNDYEVLAKQIDFLLSNTTQSALMAEKAYESAITNFNAQHNSKKIINIYRQLVKHES